MQKIDLGGVWECEIRQEGAAKKFPMRIPGTLDENAIGERDEGKNQWHPDAQVAKNMANGTAIATRLTRRYTHEGPARITRRISQRVPESKRVFLEVERSRHLTLEVNGRSVPHIAQASISTPYIFELTGLLQGEDDEITLIADNSYPGWPREAIVNSSAATDETQTNWNGLLGYVRLVIEEETYISRLCVYPKDGGLRVHVLLNTGSDWAGTLALRSDALCEELRIDVCMGAGEKEIMTDILPVREDAARWDLDEGNLYSMTAQLSNGACKEAKFGIRSFGANENGRLTINGRVFFVRSEANCAEFPETGHPPMDVEEWEKILRMYRSYGVNCMRFHSHIPPEAAFEAADRLGMLMQPELSHWNPRTAFEDEASRRYYRDELTGTLFFLANHPSFVMMTYGNELCAGESGHAYMNEMIALAHDIDDTRLFASASNGEYGQNGCDAQSDFYASQSYRGHTLRATSAGMKGHLNGQYPGARTDYEESMALLRREYKKPVFSFEVGQYEVLPDFDEMNDFHGVTLPENYRIVRDRVRECGLEGDWKRYVEATGEISNMCYREEIEAALRTQSMSGISLLGLQDFPGQGTALVGMLNAHLQPKPFDFARPERFSAFFADVLPLAMLEKYTYEEGERLEAAVKLANYGKSARHGRMQYEVRGEGVCIRGEAQETQVPAGGLCNIGRMDVRLEHIEKAVCLTLQIEFDGAQNSYPIWVYPACQPKCPANVYECRYLDEKARRVLRQGGCVYLSPESTREALPDSIQGQFSTDFWSVGTFPFQEGGMGQLIDDMHPLFEGFPTKNYTQWQWWAMAGKRALILPERYKAIVTEMDSYAYLRPMAQLLECRCGGGRLLLSTMELQKLQHLPEGRALQNAIYRYMASDKFAPEQEIAPEVIEKMVKKAD